MFGRKPKISLYDIVITTRNKGSEMFPDVWYGYELYDGFGKRVSRSVQIYRDTSTARGHAKDARRRAEKEAIFEKIAPVMDDTSQKP